MDVTQHSASADYQRRIELSFDQLKNDVWNFMTHEASAQETIRQLKNDLNVHKLALAQLESTKYQLETEGHRLRRLCDDAVKQGEALKDLVKGDRVVVLVDGDGAIFSCDLISRGQQGGHHAARTLSDSITQHLCATYGTRPYQLWISIFYNKRGLTDTFGRTAGLASVTHKFDDFVLGFNQAAERFVMVDVGTSKEAADAKLKVHLEDAIRLPQSCKIVFGGCHDNGYIGTLRSQITAGFRDKLILLKGYTQMATEIADLGLPSLTIPDLFIPQKLITGTRWIPTPSSNQPSPTENKTILNQSPNIPSLKIASPESFEVDPAGSTYSRVLQRTPASFRENSPSTEASWEDSYSPSNPGTRHINPQLRLSKQKPPPCTLFYLANCKHGSKCKYGHNYLLNDEHFEEMRANARLGPCPMMNKGEPCPWGDGCVYGHYCPHSSTCHYFKVGSCKFKGVDMHRGPAGL
ncbi:hypothetical protein C8J57DRAFT_1293593 [Mycena rebaudengoi]|nr:hypothetical protein C8J57DRAFT_1293593 [Mycena rebaudengoi]